MNWIELNWIEKKIPVKDDVEEGQQNGQLGLGSRKIGHISLLHLQTYSVCLDRYKFTSEANKKVFGGYVRCSWLVLFIDACREGLEPPMLRVCNLSLKD